MKALSIKQPWAQLILDGYKTLEVRTWATTYRGTILVHAARRDARGGLPEHWPRGAIVGQVDIVECRSMRQRDAGRAWADRWDRDWYVFELRNPIRFGRPVPLIGTTGLFEVDHDVVAHVAPIPLRRSA